MGFPSHKPPISSTCSSSSRTPSPTPSSSNSRPGQRNLQPYLSRSETYLSPLSPFDNRPRAVRERRRRRRLGPRRTQDVEAPLPRDLTTASFLASSFQINTTPNMSYIPFSKPLFGTYPTLFVQPHVPTMHSDRAMEIIDGQPPESNEIDDIPSDLFSVEFMFHNRALAMEVLLGNLAGDESFADLLGLPTDAFSDNSDEDEIYEDDMDSHIDIDRTNEDVSEEASTDRGLHGDILRGVDEDYD